MGRNKFNKRAAVYLKTDQVNFSLLESSSLKDIKTFRKIKEKYLKYHREYYQALEKQRVLIIDQLCDSLNEGALHSFQFKGWQRLLKYRYSHEPLSTKGSLTDPGHRFNLGKTDFYPNSFSALYLAKDKETSLLETLGQSPTDDNKEKLTAFEKALTSQTSISIISLSGQLERVLDLRDENSLNPFCKLIKDFKLPYHLFKMAKELKQPPPNVIKQPKELLKTLLDPNWTVYPMQFDVPANSQLFGEMAFKAGITGIIYPSKMNKKDCLVAFPNNFENSSSFIKLDDPPPNINSLTILNSSTWKECI